MSSDSQMNSKENTYNAERPFGKENWPEKMEQCGYFAALVTDGFFQDATCQAQAEHAATLGLPVFVLIHADQADEARAHEGFFDGCDVRLRETFSGRAELLRLTRRMRTIVKGEISEA